MGLTPLPAGRDSWSGTWPTVFFPGWTVKFRRAYVSAGLVTKQNLQFSLIPQKHKWVSLTIIKLGRIWLPLLGLAET